MRIPKEIQQQMAGPEQNLYGGFIKLQDSLMNDIKTVNTGFVKVTGTMSGTIIEITPNPGLGEITLEEYSKLVIDAANEFTALMKTVGDSLLNVELGKYYATSKKKDAKAPKEVTL